MKGDSKVQVVGKMIGALLGNITVGASYALGGLLVWELFFR